MVIYNISLYIFTTFKEKNKNMLTTKFLSGAIEASLTDIARVNCQVSKEFESDLKELANKTERLILNLEGVRFIDTYGFEALLKAKEEAKDKQIEIKNASEDVRELFQLLKIETEFQFSEN